MEVKDFRNVCFITMCLTEGLPSCSEVGRERGEEKRKEREGISSAGKGMRKSRGGHMGKGKSGVQILESQE